MKRFAIILILAASTGTASLAQSTFDIAYSIGFATGDLGDFISDPSFRGITMDYRYNFQPNMAIGFSLGWNTFYSEEGVATYTVENQSLTGKQYRYSNNLPMLVNYTYLAAPEEFISPYASLGIGTMYARRNTDMNLYTIEEEGWPFVVQPEIGVRFRSGDNVGTVVNVRYLYGSEAGDFNGAQSYITLNLGLSFY